MDNGAGDPDDTSSQAKGGAIFIYCNDGTGSPDAAGATHGTLIVNCKFAGNRAAKYGGAIYGDCKDPASGDNEMTVADSTFAKNDASGGNDPELAGGIYHKRSDLIVRNSVFWGNTDDNSAAVVDEQIYQEASTGTTSVKYGDVQDADPDDASIPFGGASNNNIDDNPTFDDYSNGDYHLASGSPCRDEGDNNSVPSGITTDRDDNSRIVNDDVDMGAYEFLASIDGVDSCADHDGTEYCLDIDSGNNIECRMDNGANKFKVDLDLNVSSATASISCVNNTYTATPNVTVDGSDSSLLIVTLSTQLPDEDCCRIDLAGPSKGSRSVTVLRGDALRDGGVTTADNTAVKQRLGDTVGSSNFQYDVNSDGSITTADSTAVKQRLGNSAPSCP